MRVVVLAHDHLSADAAKTGNSVVKYARNGWSARYAHAPGPTGIPVATDVVAVVDRGHPGADAGDFLGPHARGIPIHESVPDALQDAGDADALVIGIAPVGGELPDAWRPDLEASLEAGMDLVSGLHRHLGDDPRLAGLAREHRVRIHDARRPAPGRHIATGDAALLDAAVVALVGTDCGSGKMTTAIELTREARARGIDAGFVATGQTGLMVGCDTGAPVDAIVSDFVAGAVEGCVLDAAAAGRTLLFVEGQGSLAHPAYGGVTASLLHGAFADALVLADVPTRTRLRFPSAVPFPKRTLRDEAALAESLLAGSTAPTVAATSLVTPHLDAAGHQAAIEHAEKALGVPATDPVREGAEKLLDAVLDALGKRGIWDGRSPVPGAKGARLPA